MLLHAEFALSTLKTLVFENAMTGQRRKLIVVCINRVRKEQIETGLATIIHKDSQNS